MTIDLKLPSNEIIEFSGDQVLMKERNQIPDLANSLFSRGQQSPIAVRRTQRRYDIASAMNAQKGVLNSPAFRSNSNRLDSESLQQLPGY